MKTGLARSAAVMGTDSDLLCGIVDGIKSAVDTEEIHPIAYLQGRR